MNFFRVMIVVPLDKVAVLEDGLKQLDLVCMHHLKVRGYHGNPNFYATDWSDELAKFELVIATSKLDSVKNTIKQTCQTGSVDDGVFSVSFLNEVGSISDL